MANQAMPRIEALGVGPLKPAHTIYEIRFGGFQAQVIMVVHQHPGKHFPARLVAGFAKGFHPEMPVAVIEDTMLRLRNTELKAQVRRAESSLRFLENEEK